MGNVHDWMKDRKGSLCNVYDWRSFTKGLKVSLSIIVKCNVNHLGPDYMSRAASLRRDDFQPGITWGEPARLMADAMNRGRPERA